MDDYLIDIRDENGRNDLIEKKQDDETLWGRTVHDFRSNVVILLARRLWFCLRFCGGRILRLLWLKRDKVISKEEQEIQKLKNDILNYEISQKKLTSQIQELQGTVDRYQQMIRNKEFEIESTRQHYEHLIRNKESEIESTRRQLWNMRSEKEELRRSKDDALSRLSELMGEKLRDNNPAITDLNDPNRPMKLGEQFNETYENEWTEAFINLQDIASEEQDRKQLSEEETIEILLNILKEVNEKGIAESTLQVSGIWQSVQSLSKDEAADFIRKVKDSHKANAVQFAPLICKKITSDDSDCKTVLKYINHCQQFVENCATICYFGAVQDPPVYFDFEPGETFDKQIFKEYTATGTKVRFLVWPALFLFRGGPLLSKGVVQPLTE